MFSAIKLIFKTVTIIPLFIDLCNLIADAIRKYQLDKQFKQAIADAKGQKDTSKLESMTK